VNAPPELRSSIATNLTAAAKGENDEHLDDSVCDSIDCVARWFHSIPCSRWNDSPATGIRGDLPHFALCDGQTHRLRFVDRGKKLFPGQP
jgi:hypothetical protein